MCDASGVSTDATPESPPTRGARRRAETRARLLEAATTLFARQGVEATAINAITERADVGFGSFYNHFTSKQEIVEIILSESLEAQGNIVDALTEPLEDPAEVVAVAHRYFVRQAATDPVLGWLLVRLDASHRVMIRALSERARRDIDRGIHSGRFTVADADAAFFDTAGALLLIMRAVLDDELGADADIHHAEGVLRILGLAADQAAEVAHRTSPASGSSTDHHDEPTTPSA
jgi:AcrR family transcriptional regulator